MSEEDSAEKDVLITHVATGRETLELANGFLLEMGKTYDVIKQEDDYVTLVDDNGKRGVVERAKVRVKAKKKKKIKRSAKERARPALNELDSDAIRAGDLVIADEEIKEKLEDLNVAFMPDALRQDLLDLWADAIEEEINPAERIAEDRALQVEQDRVALEANRDLLRDTNDTFSKKIKDKAVIEGQDKQELNAIIVSMLKYRVGNAKILKRMLRSPSVEQIEYDTSIRSPLMKTGKDEEEKEGKLEDARDDTDEDELDKGEIEADEAEYQTLGLFAKLGRKEDLNGTYENEEYAVLRRTEDEYVDLMNNKKTMSTAEFESQSTALESRLIELYAAVELREDPFFQRSKWTSLLDFLNPMAVIEDMDVTSTDEEVKTTLQSPAFEAATFYVYNRGVASRLRGIGNVDVKTVWVDAADVEKWYLLPNGEGFDLNDAEIVETKDDNGAQVRLVSAYNLAQRLRSETRNAIYEYTTAFVQNTGDVELDDGDEFVVSLSDIDNNFMRSLKNVQKLYNNATEIGPDDLPKVTFAGLNRYIEGLKAHAATFGLPFSIDPTLADIATGALDGETLTRKIRTRDQKELDSILKSPDTVSEVLSYVAELFRRVTGESLPKPDLNTDVDLIDDSDGIRTRQGVGGSGFKLGDLSSYKETLPYSKDVAQFNDFEELKLEYETIKKLLKKRKAEAVERWIRIISFGKREEEYQRLVRAGDAERVKEFTLNNLRPDPKYENGKWTFLPSPTADRKDLKAELDRLYQASLQDNIEFQRRVLEGAAKIAADRILGALTAKSVVVVFQGTDPRRDDYATICKYKDPTTRVYIGNVAYIGDSKGKASLVYVHTVDDLGEDGVRIQFSQDYRTGRGRKGYDYLGDLREGQEIEILPRVRRDGDKYYNYSGTEIDSKEMKRELTNLIDGLVTYPLEEACREFRLHVPDTVKEEVEKEENDIGDTKDDAYNDRIGDNYGAMKLTYNAELEKFRDGYAISESETDFSDRGSSSDEDDGVDSNNAFLTVVENIVEPAWDLKDDNARFAARIQGKPLIKDDDKAALDDIVTAMINFKVGNEQVLNGILREDAIASEFYRTNVASKLTSLTERGTALGKIERVLGEEYFDKLRRITSAKMVEMGKEDFITAMIATQRSIINKEIPEDERQADGADDAADGKDTEDDSGGEEVSEEEDDEVEIAVAELTNMVNTELRPGQNSRKIIDDIIARMATIEGQEDFKIDFLKPFPSFNALNTADKKMILSAFNAAVFGDDAEEDVSNNQEQYDSFGNLILAELNTVYYAIRAFLGFTSEEEVTDSRYTKDLRTNVEALKEERGWLDRYFYGDPSKRNEQVSVVGRVDFLLHTPQYFDWRCLEYLSPKDDIRPIFRFDLNTDLMNLWSKTWWYQNCKYGVGRFSKGNIAIQTPDQLLQCVDRIMAALGALQQGYAGAQLPGSKIPFTEADVHDAMFDLIRFTTMLKYFQLALESRIDAVLGGKDHMLDEDSIEYHSWTTTRYDFVSKFLDEVEGRIMARPAAFVHFLLIGFGIKLNEASLEEVVANPGLVIFKTMFGGQYLFAAEPKSSKPPPNAMNWWRFEVIGTSPDDIKERVKGLLKDRGLKFKDSKSAKRQTQRAGVLNLTQTLDYSQGQPDDEAGAGPGRKGSAGTAGYTDRIAQPTKGYGTCGI